MNVLISVISSVKMSRKVVQVKTTHCIACVFIDLLLYITLHMEPRDVQFCDSILEVHLQLGYIL